MDDKAFQLLEKMYGEMTNGFTKVNERMDKLESKVDSLESKVGSLENDVRNIGVTIDGEIKPKIQALFDGYVSNNQKFEELSDKIDNMQIDINTLSIKSLRSDSTIIEIKKRLKV